MRPHTTLGAIFLSLLLLAGCQSAYKPNGDYYFSTVEVAKTTANGSPAIAAMTRDDLLRAVGDRPAKGAPKRLDVTITDVHFKNPVLSLLVGDGNRMASTASIRDAATGKTEWEQKFVTTDKTSYILNGVAGIAVSALQNKRNVEEKLARGAAEQIGGKALGGKSVRLADTKPANRTLPSDSPAPGRRPTDDAPDATGVPVS